MRLLCLPYRVVVLVPKSSGKRGPPIQPGVEAHARPLALDTGDPTPNLLNLNHVSGTFQDIMAPQQAPGDPFSCQDTWGNLPTHLQAIGQWVSGVPAHGDEKRTFGRIGNSNSHENLVWTAGEAE